METMRAKPDGPWDWRAALSAGRLAQESGDLERAISHFEDAHARATVDGGKPKIGETLNALAVALAEAKRFSEAESTMRAAHDFFLELGDDAARGAVLSNLAQVLTDTGRLTEAEDVITQALVLSTRETSPHEWAVARNNLAVLQSRQGKYAEAEMNLRDALETNRRHLRGDDPRLINLIANLGAVAKARGDSSGAAVLLREAFEIAVNALGANHPSSLSISHQLEGLR